MCKKVFYKYRPASEFTIALLEKQEMKFSYAHEYNDPFDSKLSINMNNDLDGFLRKLEESSLDEVNKRIVRNKIINGEFTNDQLVSMASEIAKHTIMSSCFAGNPKNLLLWSHYADSHKGICIGIRNCSSTKIAAIKFNVKECCVDTNDLLSDGLFIVHKVKYSDSDIVEWNPIADPFKLFMDAHKNKAKCWEYENEHRLLVPAKAFNTTALRFDPRFLVEVYLGCCIEADFRTKVLQALKKNYLSKGIKVKIFEMIRSQKRFALEKKELVI